MRSERYDRVTAFAQWIEALLDAARRHYGAAVPAASVLAAAAWLVVVSLVPLTTLWPGGAVFYLRLAAFAALVAATGPSQSMRMP